MLLRDEEMCQCRKYWFIAKLLAAWGRFNIRLQDACCDESTRLNVFLFLLVEWRSRKGSTCSLCVPCDFEQVQDGWMKGGGEERMSDRNGDGCHVMSTTPGWLEDQHLRQTAPVTPREEHTGETGFTTTLQIRFWKIYIYLLNIYLFYINIYILNTYLIHLFCIYI